jgi:hypothetical protein
MGGATERVRYIEEGEEIPVVELTRRNLIALLAKLDDPLSARTLVDPEHKIAVTAVPDEEHYRERAPGVIYMPSSGRTY